MRSSLALAAVLAVGLAACTDTVTEPAPLTETAAAKPAFSDAAKPSGSTIFALAGAAGLTELAGVIEYSDDTCGTSFEATLDGKKGQFTVFAPTNEAFGAIIAQLGAPTVLSCDVLPVVLSFHVTRGRHTSNSVLAHDRFRMLSGEYAAVDADALTIAGARLNLGLIDNSASNGIVHVVDDVLVPGSILAALAN